MKLHFQNQFIFIFFVAWKVFLLYFHFADDDDMIQYELPMRYWRYIYALLLCMPNTIFIQFSPFFFRKGGWQNGTKIHFLKNFSDFLNFIKKVFELNFFVEFLSLKGPLLWNFWIFFVIFQYETIFLSQSDCRSWEGEDVALHI